MRGVSRAVAALIFVAGAAGCGEEPADPGAQDGGDVSTLAAATPSTAGLVTARTVPTAASALATFSAGTLWPSGAGVPVDTLLRIAFDAGTTPTLGTRGTIKIFRSDGTLVDVIDLADGPAYGALTTAKLGLKTIAPFKNTMVNVLGGTSSQTSQLRFVYYTPVIVTGNTVTIFPHRNRLTWSGSSYGVAPTLDYGATYYVTVDAGVLNGTRNGAGFGGITGSTTWRFSTKPTAPAGPTFAVNGNNGADFATVQGAIEAVPASASAAYTISVAPGVYQELLFSAGKKNVTIKGTSGRAGADTIVQYDNCEDFNRGVGNGTPWSAVGSTITLDGAGNSGGRALFLVSGGDRITLDGITLLNTHGQNSATLPTVPAKVSAAVNTQAEALYFNSGATFAAKRSNFVSYQDTLQLKGFTWFYDCVVAGDVDFIWGYPYVGLFERSEIRSRYRTGAAASVVQSRAFQGYPGFVFLSSALTKESGTFTAYLGRTAGTLASGSTYGYDDVAVVGSILGAHISTAGWSGAANVTATPVAGWRQSGNITPAGAAVSTSRYVASSRTLTSTEASTFFPDRATLFGGKTSGGYTAKGLSSASASMTWTGYAGFFSP